MSNAPFHKTLTALAVALFAATASPVHAGVSEQDIQNDATTTNDVVTYGLGTQGQRYSALNRITTGNVVNLVPVWSLSFGGEKQRGQESQPLITADGKMFVTASYSRLFAIDARTGRKLWQYEHRLPDGIMPCCDVVNRGAALYDNLVIFATLDAQLVALDQDTGNVVWKEKLEDYKAGYSATAAPMIAKDMVHHGHLRRRVRRRRPRRCARREDRQAGLDAAHGRRTHGLPEDGKENGISGVTNKSWPGDLWKTGGAATWLGGTYDPETDLIYFGTGNPAPWNSHLREGDNLYLLLDARHRRGDRADRVALPEHAQRRMGLRRRQRVRHLRMRRMGAVGGKADRNGFFYVNDATHRKARERLSVREEDHVGEAASI